MLVMLWGRREKRIRLTSIVPLPKRPAAMGVISSMWAIASVAGPLLGGVFTSVVEFAEPVRHDELTRSVEIESPGAGAFTSSKLYPVQNTKFLTSTND